MKLAEAFILLTERRSQSIDVDDAVDYIQKYCKDFINNQKRDIGPDIYRGLIKSGLAFLVTPSTSVRRSRNTENFYTYFIDNSKRWSHYPKRSQSIICTSSGGKASSFGELFVVIPRDGAKFGICSQDDFWFSFDYCMGKLGLRSMKQFNRVFRDTATIINTFVNDPIMIDDEDHSIRNIERNFKNIYDEGWTAQDVMESESVKKTNLGLAADTLKGMLKVFFVQGGIQAGMDYLLDPEKNKFKLESYPIKKSSVKGGEMGNEVWTDSDCIMFSAENFYLLENKLEI